MTVSDRVSYLRSLRSVRETNANTIARLESNTLNNFTVHNDKMEGVVRLVVKVIRESFPTNTDLDNIPDHGRYQHFGVDRMADLIASYRVQGLSDQDICCKLVDLFVVSVLLDAGAGPKWKYTDPEGHVLARSEGIAVATYYMFQKGAFGDGCVDGVVLANLSAEVLRDGLQIQEGNHMVGFDGRLQLMHNLGRVLVANKEFANNHPGDMVNFIRERYGSTVDMEQLWSVIMGLLVPIWPSEGRLIVDGEVIGDAWSLADGTVVTFHKLTQWLAYSLLKPLTEFGHFKVENRELLTGLPEYRNGGLFVDLGVLELKKEKQNLDNPTAVPSFAPDDDVIVEWRSCTICLLDQLLPLVNAKLGHKLTLPQLIEAGSWKSGRVIASQLRADGGPPIDLDADGTVF